MRPIPISNQCLNRDIPFMGLSLLLVIILSISGRFIKADGDILGLMFIFYITFNVRSVRHDASAINIDPSRSLIANITKLIASLTILSIAAYILVESARGIALYFQISEFIVGKEKAMVSFCSLLTA